MLVGDGAAGEGGGTRRGGRVDPAHIRAHIPETIPIGILIRFVRPACLPTGWPEFADFPFPSTAETQAQIRHRLRPSPSTTSVQRNRAVQRQRLSVPPWGGGGKMGWGGRGAAWGARPAGAGRTASPSGRPQAHTACVARRSPCLGRAARPLCGHACRWPRRAPGGGAVGARAGLRARTATPASGEAAAEAETKARDGGAGRAQQRSRVCERARACGGTGTRRAMALVTAHSPPPGARKPFMKSISDMWGGEDERRERESKVSHERPRRFWMAAERQREGGREEELLLRARRRALTRDNSRAMACAHANAPLACVSLSHAPTGRANAPRARRAGRR